MPHARGNVVFWVRKSRKRRADVDISPVDDYIFKYIPKEERVSWFLLEPALSLLSECVENTQEKKGKGCDVE